MSNEENNIENLLQKWGYGKEIINKFKDEGIRESHLLKVTEYTLEKLFPKAGERLDFIDHIRNYETDLMNKINRENQNEIGSYTTENFHEGTSQYQRSQTLYMENLDENQQNSGDLSVDVKIDPLFLDHVNDHLHSELNLPIKRPRMTHVLESLLDSTPEGKMVIANFNTEGKLNDCSRLKIGDEIIREELKTEIDKNFPYEKVQYWTRKVLDMFPGEIYENWAGSTQGKSRNTSAGRGILLCRYYSMRRKLIKAGVIKKSSTAEPQSPTHPVMVDETILEDVEDSIQWLKNNSESVESAIDKWKFSSIVRLKYLKETMQTIYEYMDDFKILKLPDAYILLEADFECHYPASVLNLFTEWKMMSLFILENVKIIEKNLIEDCLTENGQKALTIRLLNSLFNVRTVFGKGKKQWRPSRMEARDGLLLFVKSEADLLPAVQEKRRKLTEFGLGQTPQVIVISKDEDTIEKSYVAINQTLYQVENPLKALDVAFKAAHVLNISYPRECCREMLFLQLSVYKFTTAEDKKLIDKKTSFLIEEYKEFKSKRSKT